MSTFQDKASLDRIQLLHPKLRAEALTIFNEINTRLSGPAKIRFSQGLRTFAEQDALFAQGRTKKGPVVTSARGGQSYHNYGMAIDIVLLIDKNGDGKYETASWDTIGDYDKDRQADWAEAVVTFKKYGWIWGADWDNDGVTKAQGDKDEGFVDQPHFQKTFGYSIAKLQALRKAKKFTGNYPNI